MKVVATLENARRILRIRATHGSFAKWLDAHHPLSPDEWRRLFRATFVFTGGEIVREFLDSSGYLPAAHRPACRVRPRVVAMQAPYSK